MIEAGLILQEAAAIYDDLNAHHVQSYGPEARGHSARSEVIISEGDIDYPKATQLDAVIFTTQAALERYSGDLKAKATMILDEEIHINERPAEQAVYRLPILKTADAAGRAGLTHVVALGALLSLAEVVTKTALESAIKDHVPRGGEDVFLQAFEAGFELGKNAKPVEF